MVGFVIKINDRTFFKRWNDEHDFYFEHFRSIDFFDMATHKKGESTL